MEHVASNLARHLKENNVLIGLQHDFREKPTCEIQLAELFADLGKQLLLDSSKALDKVNHPKLLFKFSTHRLTEKLWISSFL